MLTLFINLLNYGFFFLFENKCKLWFLLRNKNLITAMLNRCVITFTYKRVIKNYFHTIESVCIYYRVSLKWCNKIGTLFAYVKYDGKTPTHGHLKCKHLFVYHDTVSVVTLRADPRNRVPGALALP